MCQDWCVGGWQQVVGVDAHRPAATDGLDNDVDGQLAGDLIDGAAVGGAGVLGATTTRSPTVNRWWLMGTQLLKG